MERKEKMAGKLAALDSVVVEGAYVEMKPKKKKLEFRKFLRQNPEVIIRVMLLLFVVLIVATWAVTKHRTEKVLEEEFRQTLSAERIKVEQETMSRMKEEYGITAENLAQKQREADASDMAKGLEAYVEAGNTDEALYMIAFSMLNRKASKWYPNDMHSVVSQEAQYMGWSDENQVSDRAYRIALDACNIYETTGAPMGRNYVYVNWSPREVKLLDNLESGQSTHTFYETDMRDYLRSRG